MKTLGRTNEGKLLVEMSEDEHASFKELSVAAEGRTFNAMMFSDMRRQGIDSDFAKTFVAIRSFTHTLFRVNEVQDLLDQFKELLEVDNARR